MTQEKLNYAKEWFESMGYDAQIDHDSIYLYLDGFSVQLSNAEIFARAEQFQDELTREN
jgi:hypothetical protein